MLSDIFSIPFLICLAICVLLIGCSSIYFYQRIMQQDHKIASMVSLISSVTEELRGGSIQPIQVQQQIQPQQAPISSRLIVVSDGEGQSDSESESDSESDSESEGSSAYSVTSEEEDDEGELLNVGEIIKEEIHLMENNDDEDESLRGEDLIEDLNLISSSLQMEDEQPSSEIKSIHLDEPLTDLSIFKSIHISGSDVSVDESTNYKKMPIQKLREIAQTQGHGDVSKLKKNEILKLLGVE